ncbi:hypothetical protein BZG01_12580 [Labilibaculum manganireducens]|uniref:TonB-dependent receptor-like beta-barrel domain-containing protein n=1 Tax=Labilibaculum manganireducens TaxID=1940525 RepID=A0A2N3I6P2_9BACT|nr:hypothetical protein [Labilibaculum manganireducens]PKQ65994.1 hypothetical protein BZG01_12580 [Labilibaculum manganireducens]
MKKLLSALCVVLVFGMSKQVYSQEQKDSASEVKTQQTTDTLISKKEEKNRNVMLNAENSTGPRNVNIGLPFRGDLVIAENGVPVVYYFYPTNPLAAWRKDNSLTKLGLLSFEEGALLYGKVGNPVRSFTRDASRKHQGYASIALTSNGTSRYDATFTGPLNKKGLGYIVSAYKNFDKGNGINYQYTDWYDNTSLGKIGIQQKYNKGSVKLIYKIVDSKIIMSNYVPLKNDGDGEFSELPTFDLGKDSYIPGSGLIPYRDAYGNAKVANLDDDKFSQSLSHNIYLVGDHQFDNGWDMEYTSLFQKMKGTMGVIFPLSTNIDPDANGGIGSQLTLNQLIPQADVTMSNSRLQFTKKIGTHRLRAGGQYQMFHREYETLTGMYTMTVEANPRIYTAQRTATGTVITYFDGTNAEEVLSSGNNGKVDDNQVNKAALYFSDDFSLGNRLDLGLGFRIEHQNYKETHDQFNSNEAAVESEFIEYEQKDKFNKVAVGNLVFKLTKNFGVIADGCYNSYWDIFWDSKRGSEGTPIPEDGNTYTRSTIPTDNEIVVTKYGAGVYFNIGSKLNLVSKITGIKKANVKSTETTLYNASAEASLGQMAGLAQLVRDDFGPELYDIQTLGWTTDIVANPFKNFNIHFLITLQNPQYKNYSLSYKFDATPTPYGVTVPAGEGSYNYSNNQVTQLSKVLLEIDPSYKFFQGKMKAWLSLRYFGKQYGNALNTVSYKPWWESFGGLDYNMSRNVILKFKVTNFLDQRGIKGDLVNSMQMDVAKAEQLKAVVASAIRPRQFELSVDFKF